MPSPRHQFPVSSCFRQKYSACGVSFSLGSNSRSVMQALQSLVPPGSKEARVTRVRTRFEVLCQKKKTGTRPQTIYIAFHDEVPFLKTVRLSRICETVRGELHRYVASTIRSRVVLHAGVVALKNKAVLIPGISQSGKSTLVAEFVKAGARFYSDEYAMIDDAGRVHAFPRPIRIRRQSGVGRIRSTWVTAESLGGRSGKKPLVIGMVLLCRYRSNAEWRPKRLAAGRASLQMMNHCLAIRAIPVRVLQLLKKIGQCVPTFAGDRGEAADVVKWCIEAAALKF